MKYDLQEHGRKLTAKAFCLDHATVRRSVSRYILHGEDGINRPSGMTVYPVDFKLNAIRMVINKELSPKETCARLNLPADPILTQWLRQYRQDSIDGLTAKPKGKQSVKKSEQAKTAKKADHLKTKCLVPSLAGTNLF